MRRRWRGLTAVLLLHGVLGVGGVWAQPPPGAVTAELGFPPPGTRLVTRRTDDQGTTTTRTWVILEEGSHEGRPVFRGSVGGTVVMYDRATRSYVATLREGKLTESFSPHAGTYSWPLRVGKSWEARIDRQDDHVRGMSWTGLVHRMTVEAHEEVTVPAGTFKAFRLRDVPVRGIATSSVVWYAPEIGWEVKRIDERDASHSRGPGKFTTELIEYHKPGPLASRRAPALRPGAPGPPGPPPPAAPAPAPGPTAMAPPSARGEFTYKVTYRVKGTAGSVMLTYRNARGGTEQASVRLPWEVSFDAKGGSFLYVSAQNQGVSGSVTCEILLDDEARTNSTSTGAYVVAECSNAAER